MVCRSRRFEAQTLGGVVDLERAGRACGVAAHCVNPHAIGVLLSASSSTNKLVDLLGRDCSLRDVLITCSVCAEHGRDRTQTNLAVEM